MKNLGKLSFVFASVTLACLGLTHFLIGGWIPFFWVLLGLFSFSLVAGIYLERKNLADFFTMKTTKHGMSMGLTFILVLALLGFLNFISTRHYKTWDFSSAQINTLSDQSIQLAKSLDADLTIKFFYKEGQEENQKNRQAFRELVKKYQDHTSRIKLEFIEVNQRPDLTEEYGVNKGSGIAFLDFKGRRNRLEKIEEQELTSALIKVTREKDKILYFTSGHGEKDLEEAQEASGLNALKLLLENNRYLVRTLSLNTKPEIPEDADVVLIIGHVQEFMPYEIEALEKYLIRGGSLFLALEGRKTNSIEQMLAKLGIVPEKNFVLNLVTIPGMGKALRQGPTFGSDFADADDITRIFGRNQSVQFILPMSLKRTELPPKVTINDLVKTNADSASFKDLKEAEAGKTAQAGPFVLGMHAFGSFPQPLESKENNDFSLVVYGDADFLTNQALYQSLNRDLVLNSIASLAKEKELISITPKETQITKLVMTTGAQATMGILVLGFPLLFLSTAILMWVRRRFY